MRFASSDVDKQNMPNKRVVNSRPTLTPLITLLLLSRPTKLYKTLKTVILSHFLNETVRILYRENKSSQPAIGMHLEHHLHHHLLTSQVGILFVSTFSAIFYILEIILWCPLGASACVSLCHPFCFPYRDSYSLSFHNHSCCDSPCHRLHKTYYSS